MTGRHNETILGYCDEVDIENFLLIDIDNTFSPQLESWIAAAESIVNGYLGYTTASGILTERIVDEKTKIRVSPSGDLLIFPRKIPIQSVEGITLTKGSSYIDLTLNASDGTPKYDIPTGSASYIQYPGYELSTSGGSSIVTSFTDVRRSDGFVKLSYTAGFDTVPYDIRQATVNLVADMVMRHSNKEGLASITQGRVSKRWESRDGKSDFYLDAMELLGSYRIASLWI